jgi:Tol biopolymer transport system component
VYFPGPAAASASGRDLVLADRTGAVESLKVPAAVYRSPRISPDGRRVAFGIDDTSEASVWIYDLSATTSPRRLTFGGKDRYPIWSADGQHVTFQSDREGDLGLFWQRADGGTANTSSSASERIRRSCSGRSRCATGS